MVRLCTAGLLALLVGCHGSPALAADEPSASGRPTSVKTELVTTDGLSQWIRCEGSGSLTLLVIPGLGAAAKQWSNIRSDLAALTRTCVYDRPGLGHSPVRSGSQTSVTAQSQAKELHALLAAAGEPGPYLVLGHSYGGLIARSFVRQYPQDIDAVLLMEGVDPSSSGGSHYWHEAGQAIDMERSRKFAAGLTNITHPLLVLSASNPGQDHLNGPKYGDSAASLAKWRDQQEETSRLSRDALWVVAHSGHVVQQDNPKATVQAVRVLLDSAKSGLPLQCSQTWASLNARCVRPTS